MAVGLIPLIIFWAITSFFSFTFIADTFVALCISMIVALIPYFWFIFPYCHIVVPADVAWIVESLKRESSKEQVESTGYRDIVAQKEFQAGFHWIFFWERPGKSVDMTRSVIVNSERDERYTLSNGKSMLIVWRIYYGPLVGNVVNYIRTDPESTKTKVRDRVRGFLQDKVGEMEKLGFGEEQKKKLCTDFALVYGGPKHIDDEERALGIQTGDGPEIVDIDEPRDVSELRNILTTVLETVEKSGGKMTYEQARGILLASKANNMNLSAIEILGTRGIKPV